MIKFNANKWIIALVITMVINIILSVIKYRDDDLDKQEAKAIHQRVEIVSNGQTHSWEIDNVNVKIVKDTQ